MIDKNGEYWKSNNQIDIQEYLNAYTDGLITDVKEVMCPVCGGTAFAILLDEDEGALQVECSSCNTKRFLLDSEELWDTCMPEIAECAICRNRVFNLMIGFVRRQNGNIKWIYLGERCTECGTLGSHGDWKIDYEPTDDMEANI